MLGPVMYVSWEDTPNNSHYSMWCPLIPVYGLTWLLSCMQDVVAGWPNEMFEPYAAYVYNVFQDQTRCPLWFEPFLHSAQRRWKRCAAEEMIGALAQALEVYLTLACV
eukprot:GHUV01049521.1.p1 GENE.GHUV01049521.1~~GHUV01049521.1.p1  ORF type:complete len:108 (-),score=18.72 GHUV01049521.1:155-478(-)